jgi:dihydroorotate dehydrogenase
MRHVCKDGPFSVLRRLCGNDGFDCHIRGCPVLRRLLFVASGTFGFGRNTVNSSTCRFWAVICVKGLTLRERLGNPPPRIAETPMGSSTALACKIPVSMLLSNGSSRF